MAQIADRGKAPQVLTPDICVIGAGPGARAAAMGAAAAGARTALVMPEHADGHPFHDGGVPAKALIAAARRFACARDSAVFGIDGTAVTADFGKLREHLRDVTAALAPNASAARLGGLGVNVFTGGARFADAHMLTVGETTIAAKHYIVAAGARPAIPLIPGLDTVTALTEETVLGLDGCPRQLIVIGGGATGLELAQAFRHLGAGVTLVEARRPLGEEDPEAVEVVLTQFAREGIEVLADTAIREVGRGGDGIRLTLETPAGARTIEGSHLLVAAGRRPDIDGLGLDAAGIKFNADGVIVDRRLRTTNPKVFAIGEAIGGPRAAHAAEYQAGVVLGNTVLRLPAKAVDALPRVTFTAPELAQTGLTEAQAMQRHRRIRVLRWALHDNDRAQIERDPCGHIKVIADTRGRILGATLVSTDAGEMISAWTLAVSRKLDIGAMAELAVPYPTRGEVGKRAAATYFSPGLKRPLLQRMMRILRRA